jgi:hypothetical protein
MPAYCRHAQGEVNEYGPFRGAVLLLKNTPPS